MMNKKTSPIVRLGLGVVAACALAVGGPALIVSANADGRVPAAPAAPASSATPTTQPHVGLASDKAQIEAEIAADEARASAAWNDPATREAVLAAKASQAAAAQAQAGKAHQQQDIRATCPVGMEPGQPPMSSQEFLTTNGQIQVIHGQCVRLYVGYAGLDHGADGAVVVTFLSTDETTFMIHQWTYPGQGPLTLTKLTSGGIATIAPASGKPFTLDVTKF